jgi:hypothetical protein
VEERVIGKSRGGAVEWWIVGLRVGMREPGQLSASGWWVDVFYERLRGWEKAGLSDIATGNIHDASQQVHWPPSENLSTSLETRSEAVPLP